MFFIDCSHTLIKMMHCNAFMDLCVGVNLESFYEVRGSYTIGTRGNKMPSGRPAIFLRCDRTVGIKGRSHAQVTNTENRAIVVAHDPDPVVCDACSA